MSPTLDCCMSLQLTPGTNLSFEEKLLIEIFLNTRQMFTYSQFRQCSKLF